MPPLHAYLTYTPGEAALAHLRENMPKTVHLSVGDRPDSADYAVLVAGRPTREQLEASPNLHTLLIPFAGLPAITAETMRDYPQIAIHNLHYNAPPTAELAVGLLLASARGIVVADQALRAGDWRPRYSADHPMTLLYRKTVLILGYGALGQHIGRVLRALGMRVIGIRRQSGPAQDVYSVDHLHDWLPQAHVLMIALPGTPHTENMIGERELAALPRGALLVNVGRAAVVDQQALYAALKSGHLGGAGLDVWYHYPQDEAARTFTRPADVPFHELENVVLSPHRGGAGASPEVQIMRMDALIAALATVADGQPLPHRVNLDLGY